MTSVPDGYEKLLYISQILPGNLLSKERITELVQNAPPASYWYVGGEPNRKGVSGAQFADIFHHYYTNIMDIDPTAKITGPSILNWRFVCNGCSPSAYVSGESWIQSFITTYQATHGQGEPPPVDVWTMDVYPIDWINTPNNDPDNLLFYATEQDFLQHWEIAVRQLQEMRQYLDTFPQYIDTPIWITEIAIHVGYGEGLAPYDGWDFDPFPKIVPKGPYRWDLMSDYINSVLDWLEANAISHKIERWFFFRTWVDIVNVGVDGYMGIIFFEGPDQGAGLNCLGEVYRARALGLPRLACDSLGNVVTVTPTPTPTQ